MSPRVAIKLPSEGFLVKPKAKTLKKVFQKYEDAVSYGEKLLNSGSVSIYEIEMLGSKEDGKS